uniref:Transcription factor CBF/NF-Y/archaeal histone domain-containing protein n=1 Tax=Setaria digitata TaxID=48799 RepID=A0A915PMJ6_9BILA
MDVKRSGNSECVGPCSSGLTSLGSVPAPIRKRRFSSAKIQPTRVKRVMQSDDEIGRMVASVPVAIGRAMEHFAEKLLETAAQCVLYSTSRTLSPSHIKQAVMQTPHFKFLEPLMREIPLPPSAGPEVHWRTDLPDQPSFSGPVTDPSCHMGMPMLSTQIGLSKLPSSGSQLTTKRRQSNGEVDGNETKPKRGRPRKVKREEKCVDDDGLLLDDKPLGRFPDANALSNGAMLSDRELMPPPNMLPVRVLATTAFTENKRNSPSKLNNNNGEQRQSTMQHSDPLSTLACTPSALQTSTDSKNAAAAAPAVASNSNIPQ